MSAKVLAIDLIKTDGGTQMRAELSVDVYMDYRDKILAGVEFPPLDVFFDGSEYWLADGFHRFYGHREAKRGSVKAIVHNGTKRDAILFAVGANTTHGLPRSNRDKRNAVLALLNDDEWVKWSDRKIADQAAVNNQTVSNVRSELSKIDSSPAAKTKDEPKIGKDGKARKANPKTDFGTRSKPAEPEAEKPKISGGATFDVAEIEAAQAGDEPDLKEKQAPYDTMLNAITQIKKLWNEVTGDERDGVYCVTKKQRVMTLLDELRPPIAQARPMKVCTFCKGNGCQKCSGCGWWPRSVVEGLSR